MKGSYSALLKKILFLLLLIANENVFTQCVSIELAINWKKAKTDTSFYNDSLCIPFLCINYRNNSDKPIYLGKLLTQPFGLPQIFWENSVSSNQNNELNISKLGYYKNSYNVIIYNFYYKDMSWLVINDSLLLYEEHEIDIINDILSEMYEKIFSCFLKYNQDRPESSFNYNISDITEYNILASLKDNFIFLKPGEVVANNYNLYGFMKIGGAYEFFINTDSLEDHVYTEPSWDKEKEMWIYGEAKLPAKVGEYQLYSGKFNTNSVKVKFGNEK